MSKIKFAVKDQNTLEIREKADIGDIIYLKDEMAIDTSSIEALVADEISNAKDKLFSEKLDAEKKLILANEQQERNKISSVLNEKIRELESQIEKDSLLKQQELKSKEDDKIHALEKQEAELKSKYEKQISELNKTIDSASDDKEIALRELKLESSKEITKLDLQIKELQGKLDNANQAQKLAVSEAEKTKNQEISDLKQKITDIDNALELQKTKSEMEKKDALVEKQNEINALNQKLKETIILKDEELRLQKDRYVNELKMKDETIEQYKDFKIRLSTKMVGESLEQHCLTEFNKVRMLAFPNAYFAKDNDISANGKKGDFIYREVDEDGVEILSIMFEMKNEMDDTKEKHKNSEFFEKLDEDRNKKKCEYAVLVSMLEADNDYYNTGIVNVSYEYPKMYVVRPHMFITLISLLREAAMNAHQYKVELKEARDADIDISNFEGKLNAFKDNFGNSYEKATGKNNKAIDDIDLAINKLQSIKKDLLLSNKYLDACSKSLEDVTIKKLTRGNPTVKRLLLESIEEE